MRKGENNMELKKCCICGKKFDGWGNNPYPAREKGECCDKCNWEIVIPMRMLLYKGQRKEKGE